MTVTMIEHSVDGGKPYKVPKLHKIVYNIRAFDGSWSLRPIYMEPGFAELDNWLKANCKHPYYHSSAWKKESFIEFECDEDAIMFTLRWC